MDFRVFISYSRKDLHLIEPVVDLLRATRDMVFHDVDTIRPGAKWREQLDAALADTNLIVVFWCRHAAGSKYVREEYEAAMASGKDVLPLLIDDTPLPPKLADFQAIDFRTSIGASHAYRRRMMIGGVLSAMLMTGAGAYVATRPQANGDVAVVQGQDTMVLPPGSARADTAALVLPSDSTGLPDSALIAEEILSDSTGLPLPPDARPDQVNPPNPRPEAAGRGLPVVLILLAAAALSLLGAFLARRRTPAALRERQARMAAELRDQLERRRRGGEA
jgi:hypothetical protein